MSHYINILEESEKHYHSAASTNKSLQIGMAVAGFALIFGIYSAVTKHYEVVNTAEKSESRWKTLEDKYTEALARRDHLEWVEQNDKSLRGWPSSRYEWDKILTYLQEKVPSPVDHMQFTSLQFTENMEGLRSARPGQKNTYPLRRSIQLQLRGIAIGTQGGSQIRGFFDALNGSRDKNEFIETVDLQPIRTWTSLDEDSGESVIRHEFSLLIDLTPNPLKP